jgi:thiol-disulfide isomerase/thioredoxin
MKRKTWMKRRIAMALIMFLAAAVPSMGSTDAGTSRADSVRAAIGKKVTLIELGSVKCTICQMMHIILNEINSVDVVFYNVRTKAGRPLAEKYRISMIPTQIFLDGNGDEFFRHEGYFPKKAIIEVLKTKGIGQ